mgnify:CR=1 FL=1
MGKEELNNIKKMYLLRMHTNKKYAIIVFCVAIVIALVDILSMVINFSTDKDVFYLNLNRNSVALFWIVILILVNTKTIIWYFHRTVLQDMYQHIWPM